MPTVHLTRVFPLFFALIGIGIPVFSESTQNDSSGSDTDSMLHPTRTSVVEVHAPGVIQFSPDQPSSLPSLSIPSSASPSLEQIAGATSNVGSPTLEIDEPVLSQSSSATTSSDPYTPTGVHVVETPSGKVRQTYFLYFFTDLVKFLFNTYELQLRNVSAMYSVS